MAAVFFSFAENAKINFGRMQNLCGAASNFLHAVVKGRNAVYKVKGFGHSTLFKNFDTVVAFRQRRGPIGALSFHLTPGIAALFK